MKREDRMNWADWEHFKRRGPVNFLRPRAQQCRINRLVASWLIKSEAERLLSAINHPLSYWADLTNDIETRLLDDGILKKS